MGDEPSASADVEAGPPPPPLATTVRPRRREEKGNPAVTR
jgi:hypothetical protein